MGKTLFYGYQRVSGNQFVYEILQFLFVFAGIKQHCTDISPRFLEVGPSLEPCKYGAERLLQ